MKDKNQSHGGSPSANAELFDLALVGHALLFVLRSLVRHPIVALAALLLVVAAAVGGMLVYPERYEVSTTILAGSPLTGALTADLNRDRDMPTRAARELILRRSNLEEVVADVQFAERYLALRPPALRVFHSIIDGLKGKDRDRESVAESLVDTLEDRLWIEAYGDTVSITMRWWDAELAFDVVQRAADSYLAMRQEAEVNTVAESIAILETHRTSLEGEINEWLSAHEANKKSEKPGATKAPRPSAARRSVAIDPDLARLQAMLTASQRAAADFESARQQRVTELQSQLLQQQTIYAADHPTIVATERLLESLRQPSPRLAELRQEARQLQEEVERRRGGNPARADAAFVAAAPNDPLQMLFEADPRETYELGLLRNLSSQLAEVNYRIASSRLNMETAQAAFKRRYATLSPPRIPDGPAKPYSRMFVAGGFLGGAVIALLACVMLDLRGQRAVERWQVEHALGLPVLLDRRR